jgi:hypothetical protein
MAMHASNLIIKFADDTTMVGLITNNDKTAYREEVRALGLWCQENNLSLNVNKTKEIMMDRKQQREHPPIHMYGTAVEKVDSFNFLGVHITNKLKWSTDTDSVVKAQQHHFNLKRLKKCGLSTKTFKLEQMHNRAHSVGLCQLHLPQPQGSPEGSAICTTHHQGQTTCPPGDQQHPMSQEGQKDHQGQQPPEPLPVHPAIIQKARSVQVHQSWDRETEKQLLSQGHPIIKQPSLT